VPFRPIGIKVTYPNLPCPASAKAVGLHESAWMKIDDACSATAPKQSMRGRSSDRAPTVPDLLRALHATGPRPVKSIRGKVDRVRGSAVPQERVVPPGFGARIPYLLRPADPKGF
jgi:hypothetical protein